MVLEVLKAIIFAGIPVAVISYYLIVLTNKRLKLKAKNSKQLKAELKETDLQKSPEGHVVQQMLHKKWLKFGGGFYGVLAFITYIHIEIYQIIDFFGKYRNIQHFLDSIGFSMVIGFFIEAITNFIQAIIWPIYWNKFLPIGSFWVWFVVVFVAHAWATKYALSKKQT